MFKKILVPYDASAPAERALSKAIEIAKSTTGDRPDVVVIHVVQEFVNYHFIERPARSIKTGEKTTLSQYLKEINGLMRDSAVEILAAKAEEIKKRDDFVIQTRVESGNIVDAILDEATKEQADLIVLGNVGRAGVSKVRTLGSVSRGVSERATCPVMIVH